MNIDQVDIDCAISFLSSISIDCAMESYGELKYHKSWDWLMPVVEKIRKKGFIFEIGNRLTDSYNVRYFVDVRHLLEKDKFTATIFNDDDSKQLTYKAVVEFIKWYKKSK